jgi:rhodanese-related sulfurtransferase
MFARLMGLRTISPGELHRRLQQGPVTVVDVNSRQSWESARVPGAVHVDPFVFADADLPPDKETALVIYCSNFMCRKAPRAARRAVGMGFRNVRVMSAGISGWLDAGLPIESSRARLSQHVEDPA